MYNYITFTNFIFCRIKRFNRGVKFYLDCYFLIRSHENENPENDHYKYQMVLLTVSIRIETAIIALLSKNYQMSFMLIKIPWNSPKKNVGFILYRFVAPAINILMGKK